jgi:hypothetical protein
MINSAITLGLVLLAGILLTCTGKGPDPLAEALRKAGRNRAELEKVLGHYGQPGDSLKRRAARFLVEHMEGHHFYEAPFLEAYGAIFDYADSIERYQVRGNHIREASDSLARRYATAAGKMRRQPDLHHVTAGLLIENIDLAFRAWEQPWARHLDFEQFCEYLLPYKAAHEKPVSWRKQLSARYAWLGDSLRDPQSAKEACTRLNRHLQSWFHIEGAFRYPVPVGVDDLFKGKIGRCSDAANLAVYTMRAVGIPVAIDFTPYWANHSLGHSWNVVRYNNGRMVNFMGAESHPGLSKVEYVNYTRVPRKRAKVYRRTYARQPGSLAALRDAADPVPAFFLDAHFRDVTAEYLPVTDVQVSLGEPAGPAHKFAYLSVFGNAGWRAIHWARVAGGRATFTAMGRNVVYLPTYYRDGAFFPAAPPFLLSPSGETIPLVAREDEPQLVRLFRKYPDDDSNTIKTGEAYELFYWRDGWVSLGRQTAAHEYLEYRNLPANALCWLRNLERGNEERIFTVRDGKQIWW